MINFTTGNIFDSDCEAIVNTVNCVGVMGKGIALETKKRYPQMYYAYRDKCILKEIKPGDVFVWDTLDPYIILNLATKNHWKNPSEYEWIEKGLISLDEAIDAHSIQSVAIPPIGCGNGGLDWAVVKDMIIKFHDLHWKNIKVVIYE